jgi:hypothetical protein
MRKAWNAANDEAAPWWPACPTFSTPSGKPRRRAVTTGAIRLTDDRRPITLPVPGTIKTHESIRKLHRRIAGGSHGHGASQLCPVSGRKLSVGGVGHKEL